MYLKSASNFTFSFPLNNHILAFSPTQPYLISWFKFTSRQLKQTLFILQTDTYKKSEEEGVIIERICFAGAFLYFWNSLLRYFQLLNMIATLALIRRAAVANKGKCVNLKFEKISNSVQNSMFSYQPKYKFKF